MFVGLYLDSSWTKRCNQVYPSNKVLQNPHKFKREIASLMSYESFTLLIRNLGIFLYYRLVALNNDVHCWQFRIFNMLSDEPNSRHNHECSKRGKNDQNVAYVPNARACIGMRWERTL